MRGEVVDQQYGIFREFRLLSLGPNSWIIYLFESDHFILEDVVFGEMLENFRVKWSELLMF